MLSCVELARDAWKVLAATAVAALVVALPRAAFSQPEAERRIVFMVDQSGSMPWTQNDDGSTRQWSFAEEIAASRDRAEAILTDLQGYDDTAVSFWIFGQRDGLSPYDVQSIDLTPSEALLRLDEFFAPEPDRYRQQRTYIAYSIFELVRQLLDLGEDFGPEDDIPADASLFYLFVFTDGGENHDGGWNNQPYIDWLLRQQRRLQLQYDTWTLYATGEDRQSQIDRFTPEPADHITYSLNFGIPTAAFSLNPNDPPSDRTVSLEVPRIIRAVPAVGGGGFTPEQIQALGLYVCSTEDVDPPPATERTELLVQAAVDWGALASGATSEWQLVAPERQVDETPVPGNAVPRRELRRDILRLRLEGNARAVIPTFQLPDGEYPIRYIDDSLCQELRRAYPNSKFLFPSEPSGALSRIGNVVVSQRPNYELALTTPASTTPDAALPPLEASRWHQYSTSERALRVVVPEGVQATVDYSVRVYRGDDALDDASDVVALVAEGERAGLVTVESGDDVTVTIPSEEQTWLRSAFGGGFDRDPGRYDVEVCARARILAAPDPSYTVSYSCPDCDLQNARVENDENGPTGICVTMTVEVGRKPLSWWWIGAIVIAALVALRIAYRWVSRPQFPEKLMVGNLSDDPDLRTAHGRGVKGMLVTYRRQPGYLDLMSNGRTLFMRDPFIEDDGDRRNTRTILGVSPSPTGGSVMLLWAAAIEDPTDDYTTHVVIQGQKLQAFRRPPKAVTDMVQIRYSDVQSKPIEIKLERHPDKGAPEVVETYLIEFKD